MVLFAVFDGYSWTFIPNLDCGGSKARVLVGLLWFLGVAVLVGVKSSERKLDWVRKSLDCCNDLMIA